MTEDHLYQVSKLLEEVVGSEGGRKPSDAEVCAAIWEACGASVALQMLVDLLNTKVMDLEEGTGSEESDTELLQRKVKFEQTMDLYLILLVFDVQYDKWLGFDSNPLYALLHEVIYCQGDSSRWSAHRIKSENDSEFDAIKAVKEGRPVLFTVED